MSYATIAALYVHSYCRQKWPEDGPNMASTVLTGAFVDVFDIADVGSHKYVPADRLTQQLAEPLGAGVYGYVKFVDGSYLLKTCKGPLAIWSGVDTEPATWAE